MYINIWRAENEQYRKSRRQLGISQAKLASILGWGASRIANYELGIRTPSLNDCRLIVMAFQKLGHACSLDDLFPTKTACTRYTTYRGGIMFFGEIINE